MTEKKLQYDCVLWFGQNYPNHRKTLIEINNDTYSQRDAMRRRAMGMQAGASDLIFFHQGIFVAIELKAPNSRHKTEHIKRQLEWGRQIADNQGFYFIINSQKDFEFIINLTFDNPLALPFYQHKFFANIDKKLSQKTVLFDKSLL